MSKIKKGILIGIGLAAVAKEQTKKILKELEKKGIVNKPKAQRMAKDLFRKAQAKERKIENMLKKELTRDLNLLKKRVKKVI
ncbi:hypothetical protein HY498_04485 [Candidatus Woesearchaeota archaeon]|nr:hypothetical protein [Candidatus Woesearchaeota archaeon]